MTTAWSGSSAQCPAGRPSRRHRQTVQTAKQIRQGKLLVRLEHVRVVGIGIHKQDVCVSVEKIVHEGEEKRLLPTPPLLPPT